MEDETIDVTSLDSLLEHLKEKELCVDWQVLTDIGPDWIGGGRRICFYLDGLALSESEFHQELQDNLVSCVGIPEDTTDGVIQGEGEVNLVGKTLEVEYWWSKAVPYQDPCDRGAGKATLIVSVT